MNNLPARAFLLMLTVILSAAIEAETPEVDDEAVELERMVVTARRAEDQALEVPASVSVIEADTLRRATQGLALDEALARVPGVFAQNRYNFAQDIRVSLRGFGARSPFGIRGVRLVLDGLPETLADGQSQVDMIDPMFLERVEVIRGPAGALYGNASGGLLSLGVRTGEPDGALELDQRFGAHGMRRTGVSTGGQDGPWNWFAGVSRTELDGYREHSESRRSHLTGRVHHEAGANSFRLLVDYVDAPGTRDPGSLTAGEVEQDRRQARSAAVDLDAGQSAEQGRLGLVYTRQLGGDQELEVRGFQTRRWFENRLPFEAGGAVEFDRVFTGAGFQYSRTDTLAGRTNRLTAGLDLEDQRDDRQRFDNLSGQKGERVFDQKEQARVAGLFVRNDLDVTSRWDISLGLRHDRVRFSIDDRFIEDGDQSGARNFSEFNYFAGTSFALAPDHRVFANHGTSFETPTFTEFANPDGTGGFNPGIAPEQARSLEAGFRGRIGEDFSYELVGYSIRVEDELLPFEPEAGGRDFFRNAGQTRRRGGELSLDWQFAGQASLYVALSAGRYRFADFTDGEGRDLGGNHIPGLPGRHGFAELAWGRGTPFMVAVNLQAQGSLYADDANQVSVPGHAVINARVARQWQVGDWRIEPFVGVNNLADRDYNSNIRINTERFVFDGPNVPAPFEPAPGRNWHAGVNLRLTAF